MLVLTKNTSENAHKQFHSGIIRNQITYETVFPSRGSRVGFSSDVYEEDSNWLSVVSDGVWIF